MQGPDVYCICGIKFESSYIEEHRRKCEVYQGTVTKPNVKVPDSFGFGSIIHASGAILEKDSLWYFKLP